MKMNVDCPDKKCKFYGGYGALGSADPLHQGTCLRGDGTCIKKGSVHRICDCGEYDCRECHNRKDMKMLDEAKL